MSDSTSSADRIRARLEFLYPEHADSAVEQLTAVMERFRAERDNSSQARWTEQDAVLITYGDSIKSPEMSGLKALRTFLTRHGMHELLSIVHLLPFFPWSSDDGFSVIDYRAVDEACGDWNDVAGLSESFDLMFDLVLNHVSAQSEWFQKFIAGEKPFDEYFIIADPEADLSHVVRPRSLPLLTPFETANGTKHVWTTFSADQVDVNVGNPQALVELIDVFLFYVSQGARIVRLDAIAYLWKDPATNCIHLPQTHEVVKLLRDVCDEVAPEVIILTETNVPHAENVSYFGDGDEAHMVYQFSLPPLLGDALVHGDATYLNQWLSGLEPPRPGTTYFNFTSSHDGIGVRPLEGLLPDERLASFVGAVRKRGGRVSTRRKADGGDSPYELNVTYWDLLGDPADADQELHLRRFLASQAVMLSLQGIPGIYIHCLVGTPNDIAGVESSGHNRRINRRKYDLAELETALTNSVQGEVLKRYQHMLSVRRAETAFHPDSEQVVHSEGASGWVGVTRIRHDQPGSVLCLTNVTRTPLTVNIASFGGHSSSHDLLGSNIKLEDGNVVLPPYQTVWFSES